MVGGCYVECFFDNFGDVFGFFYYKVVFYDWLCDIYDVGFLESIIVDLVVLYLVGNNN